MSARRVIAWATIGVMAAFAVWTALAPLALLAGVPVKPGSVDAAMREFATYAAGVAAGHLLGRLWRHD